MICSRFNSIDYRRLYVVIRWNELSIRHRFRDSPLIRGWAMNSWPLSKTGSQNCLRFSKGHMLIHISHMLTQTLSFVFKRDQSGQRLRAGVNRYPVHISTRASDFKVLWRSLLQCSMWNLTKAVATDVAAPSSINFMVWGKDLMRVRRTSHRCQLSHEDSPL